MGKGSKFGKKPIYIIFIITFLIGLFATQIQSSSALPYNYKSEGLTFKGFQEVDRYSEIQKQYCTFEITKMQDTQEQNSTSYSDEGYENGATPEEWGCEEKALNQDQLLYYSKILESEVNISWADTGSNRQYSPHSKDSTKCIKLKHEAL